MNYMIEEELLMTKGGATSITGTFLNAVTRLFSTFLEVGRAIGSSIMRLYSGNTCM